MLIRLVAVLISVPYLLIGQDLRVDKPYEETGTFFDFNTGEYLLVTRENGNLTVRYSNGTKPFEDLIVLSDSAKPCCCKYTKCFTYCVAFKSNPKAVYWLRQNYGEWISIARFDDTKKLINIFSHCSNDVINQPNSIKSVAGYWGGTYSRLKNKAKRHNLTIETNDGKPEFTLQIGNLRVTLIPGQYDPSMHMLTGKTNQGQEFSIKFHSPFTRQVSLKIANLKAYKEEQWFEFGNQQK